MSRSWQSENRWAARRKLHDYGRMLHTMGMSNLENLACVRMVLIGAALVEDWAYFAGLLDGSLRPLATSIVNNHLGEDHEQD